MLEQGNGGNLVLPNNNTGSYPRTVGCKRTMGKRLTVKELLKKRQQESSCLPKNNAERECESAKYKATAAVSGLHLLNYAPAVIPDVTTPLASPALHSCHAIGKQMELPVLQRQVPPDVGARMSLFHWQLEQEAQRLEGVSPELFDMQDADGDTFLHIAVAQGRRALAYVIATKMAKSGSLDRKEHNHQTALHVAAATNQHLIIHDLLTLGAQHCARDLWGRSPLHICTEKGHYLSLKSICASLLSRGGLADIDMINYEGLTPLHSAVLCHNATMKALRNLEDPSLIPGLTQRRQMYTLCINALLSMGASCKTLDLKSGQSCLHMVSDQANLELMNIFLQHPSSPEIVNVQSFSGNTALHITCSLQQNENQMAAVKLLLSHGADPGIRNRENELALQLLPQSSMGKKIRLILKRTHIYV